MHLLKSQRCLSDDNKAHVAFTSSLSTQLLNPPQDTLISMHVLYSFLLRDARNQQGHESVTSAGLTPWLSSDWKDILGSVQNDRTLDENLN